MKGKKKKQTARSRALESVKNVYCRLRPSKVSGVGVYAIRDIPAKTTLFTGVKPCVWYRFSVKEFAKCGADTRQMVDDFLVVEKDGTVLVPSCGFDGMDISFFLNHSAKNPNIKTDNDCSCFVTIRKIKKGEELLVDYGTYDYKYSSK